MRLQRHRTGIVAIPALFAAVAAAQASESAIQYSDGFYGLLAGASTNAVFTPLESQAITLAVRSGVVINGASLLYGSTVVATNPASSTPTAAATLDTSGNIKLKRADKTQSDATGAGLDTGKGSAPATATAGAYTFATPGVTPTFQLQVQGTLPQTAAVQATIIFNSSAIVNKNYDKLVHFRIDWSDTVLNDTGFTESTDLVYVADADPASVSSAASMLPTAATQSESTSTGAATALSTAATNTAAATTTANAAKTTSASASPGSTSAVGAAPSKSASKGISGGAIAGIVVGIIALVAIAGLAVFFCLRRRSTSNTPSSSYRGSGSEQIGLQSGFASAAVVEKDGFGGAGAHSPYTDDASYPAAPVPAAPASAAAAASPVAAAAPAAAPAPVSPPKQAPAQPAVSNQVAALIEDHMTPDEIARLAAEEEELDAAIAKAHRSRQASQA